MAIARRGRMGRPRPVPPKVAGRYKSLIGPRLRARRFAAQQTEAAFGVGRRLIGCWRPDVRIPSVASRSSHSAAIELIGAVRQRTRPEFAHRKRLRYCRNSGRPPHDRESRSAIAWLAPRLSNGVSATAKRRGNS